MGKKKVLMEHERVYSKKEFRFLNWVDYCKIKIRNRKDVQ